MKISSSLLLLGGWAAILSVPAIQGRLEMPSEITLKAGVLHAPPFASVEETLGGTPRYSGFQPDFLQRLQVFAKEDNVTLKFELSPSPPQYGQALDLVADDCNTTENPQDLADCQTYDMIVGDYYCNPARSVRVDFTPSWLRTTMSTIKYLDKTGPDFTTLTQAAQAKATVCVPEGTYLMTVVMDKFPNAEYLPCLMGENCIEKLKAEECVLYVNDELLLRALQAEDPTLEVTREQFNTQYLVWPMKYSLPPVVRMLVKKWMYAAVSNATLDELYFTYFQKQLCPVGTAGSDCELPCDPDHGTSDARGVCVCESSKWTGEDCSIEVEEELNMLSEGLKITAFAMFGVNCLVILLCAVWLGWQRNSAQVRVSQPSFLLLVLLGCLISSSTIIAMSQEEAGYGSVPACMAIPWLYSVGFSITFGTLFAKIRRVYLIFMQAAAKNGGSSGIESRNNGVTIKETITVIGGVLLIDLFILITWTIFDPLEWQRTVTLEDQFGVPLESEGHCTSDNWVGFAAAIAALHLVLLGVACFMCYVARDIPTKFSEGKYLSIAMISNLQIFIVGVPILIILGTDPQASFFVRSVIIWMNDLAVVTLIFGNLMYSVHMQGGNSEENMKRAVGQAINRVSVATGNKRSGKSSGESASRPTQTRSVMFSEAQENEDETITASKHSAKQSRRASTASKASKASSKVSKGSGIHKGSRSSRKSSKYHDYDDDESDHETFADEQHDTSGKKPVDVLAGTKSWANVNMSTFSVGHDNDESTSETDDVEVGNANGSGVISNKSPLPPASLPKKRPENMSYAHDRINNLRGKHAKVMAARKGKR